MHKKKCFFSERNAILAQRAFRPHLDRGESQALTQHRRAYVVDEKRYATEGSEQSTHFLTQSFQCQTNPVATSLAANHNNARTPPPSAMQLILECSKQTSSHRENATLPAPSFCLPFSFRPGVDQPPSRIPPPEFIPPPPYSA